MNNEFKKSKSNNETRYVLENSATVTTGSVATAPSSLGKVQKRGNILAQEAGKDKVPATTPRNFVAKNAKSSGAGAHKDKKREQKQGTVKHKKPYMESLKSRLDNLQVRMTEARMDPESLEKLMQLRRQLEQLKAAQSAPELTSQQQSEIDQWEKDFAQRMATRSTDPVRSKPRRDMPGRRLAATVAPEKEPVKPNFPKKHSELVALKKNLDKVIDVKQKIESIIASLGGEDALPPNIKYAIDDSIYAHDAEKDGYQGLLDKNLKSLYILNNHRGYKKLVKKDKVWEQGVAEGSEGQTPDQEIERLKLRQNAEHGKAPLRRQAATQARIRELEKQIKDKQGVAEGVAETLPMHDAVKVLRQYGADNFKTTSNELHFYKQGRPFSVDLIWGNEGERSVNLSQLNSATRGLKGQGVAEVSLNELAPSSGSEGNGPFDYGSAIIQIGQDFINAYDDDSAGEDAAEIIKVGKTFMSAGMKLGIAALFALDTQVYEHVLEQLSNQGFNVRADIISKRQPTKITRSTQDKWQAIQDKFNSQPGNLYQVTGYHGYGSLGQKVKALSPEEAEQKFIAANSSPKTQFNKIEVSLVKGVAEGGSRRLVMTDGDGAKVFKIYKDIEWGEYVVKFFVNGRHQTDADYHTDDKNDAIDTAQRFISGEVDEGYSVMPGINKDRYQERPGLEGPFTAKNGKVVYYDPKEGKYYDPDSDFYIDHDEWQAMNKGTMEGAKVDRQAKHIATSMMKKGKSKKEADSIAWAHIKHPKNEDAYFESLTDMLERQLEPEMGLNVWEKNFLNANPYRYHQFQNKTPQKKR